MGVVVDAELVRNGEKQGISFRNSFILRQLLDEGIRLCRIGAAENGSVVFLDEADGVLCLRAMAEIGSVAIVNYRERRTAGVGARHVGATSGLPRRAVGPDPLSSIS